MAIKKIQAKNAKLLVVDIVDDSRRVAIYIEDSSIKVVDDKCPHKGGPLHLCYQDESGVKKCPWHDRSIKEHRTSSHVSAIYHRNGGYITLICNSANLKSWPVKVVY